MRKATALAASAAFAVFGWSSLTSAEAGPSYFLQLGEPVFCFGYGDDLNRCLLYLGDKDTCATLTPCPVSRIPTGVPTSIRAVGGDQVGMCHFVVSPPAGATGDNASADAASSEPMCRFEITREPR